MTWLQVTDTAVKIGVGAIITGVTAYFIARREHTHDFEKEYFKRRQDVIEKVAEKFEETHIFFLDLCLDYFGYVKSYAQEISPTDSDRERYCRYMREIGVYLRGLHILEGKLVLVNIQKCTNCLREYRLLVTDVNNMLNLEKPKITKEELGKKIDEICLKKDSFYQIIGESYRNI